MNLLLCAILGLFEHGQSLCIVIPASSRTIFQKQCYTNVNKPFVDSIFINSAFSVIMNQP